MFTHTVCDLPILERFTLAHHIDPTSASHQAQETIMGVQVAAP